MHARVRVKESLGNRGERRGIWGAPARLDLGWGAAPQAHGRRLSLQEACAPRPNKLC